LSTRANVLVDGGFDDLRSRDIRFLQEASHLGEVTVRLWHDQSPNWRKPPKFPFSERAYILKALKFVCRVTDERQDMSSIIDAGIWADMECDASVLRENTARDHGFDYRIIADSQLTGFPQAPPSPSIQTAKVAVTGCFDWLHSGHVRFFEEAARFGELTVFVGNDATIANLKGSGHPKFPEGERCFLVNAIKHVHHAQVSTGSGWLDADAEIRALKPDVFVVNQDGDKDCKREYCRDLGIEYRVLRREPAIGLPSRSSTALRGF
jgi:cytidyltransferase-like protein